MNRDQMVELWERHTAYEFALKDANLAVSTMVDDASVMHLPTMSGGFGKENLRHYYAPVRSTPESSISRSITVRWGIQPRLWQRALVSKPLRTHRRNRRPQTV
jgi:hypothetical protein